MRRLKNPRIKEVSLALDPVNKKTFLFIKEDDMEQEIEIINNKLNELLGVKDEKNFDKSEDFFKAVEEKVTQLGDKVETEKANKEKLTDIITILGSIVDYLKKLNEELKSGKAYGYGYPAPKKEDENVQKEEPKKEEIKKEEIKKEEPKTEPTFTIDEVKELIKEVTINE